MIILLGYETPPRLMDEIKYKSFRWYLRASSSPYLLCAIAFFLNLHVGMTGTAWPWRVVELGGGSQAIGGVGGMLMGCYLLALLAISRRRDRLSPKRMLAIACAAITIVNILTAHARSVEIMLVLVGLSGSANAFIWPPLMSWVSAGQSGRKLNFRMGIYNFSWTSGSIIGFWMGGALWNSLGEWIFYLAAAMSFVSLLMTFLARKKYQPVFRQVISIPPVVKSSEMELFRRVAQVSLFAGWLGLGSIRFPLTKLIQDMSLGAETQGAANSCIMLTFTATMLLLGRSSWWHCRLGFFVGSQVLTAAAIFALAVVRSGIDLCLLCGLSALGMTMIYVSHMFYSLSSGRNRMASMWRHEVLLALGFMTGSYGGGLLIHFLGPRNLYPIVSAIILLVVVVEILVYLRARRQLFPAGK
jgi:predicted MFS family arabinose efflux permease